MLLLWGTCLNTSVPATSSTRSTYPTLWFPGGPILPSPRAPPSSFPSAPMSLQLPSSLHQEALAVKPQRLSPLGLGEELRTPRALPLTSLHLRGVPGGVPVGVPGVAEREQHPSKLGPQWAWSQESRDPSRTQVRPPTSPPGLEGKGQVAVLVLGGHGPGRRHVRRGDV